MPPEDEPVATAVEVEAEESAPNRIWLLPESISRERLSELRIRIMDEQEFSIPVEGQTEPMKIKVWGVSERAKSKLREAGYAITVDEDPELKIKVLVLTNPDGALAKVGIDPRTIKVVKMDNSGMAAPMQQWLKEQILAKLSPTITAPISVVAGDGNRQYTLLDSTSAKFQIAFCSSPIILQNGNNNTAPRTAWGITTGVSYNHCDVWYGGTPIISEDGVEVGAIDDYNVCLYWRFDTMANHDDAKNLLTKILDTVVRMRANPGEFKVPEELVKANYVRTCSNRLQSEQAALRAEVEKRQKEVLDYGDKLIESTRRGEHARASLNGFAAYTQDMTKRLESEFAGIKHMKNVADVGWRGDCLVVTTDTIYVVDTRTKVEHDIGRFRILLDHRRSEPHMFNLTRRVNAHSEQMHHPHIFAAGNPCMGNMGEALPVALAQYQWTVVVQLCLVFLQHANVEDVAGMHINKWPISERYKLAEEQKKLIAEIKGAHVPAT